MKIVIDGTTVWINYHHLYCFYIIAKVGSLTKASKLLGIGQSALSIQMKQFEHQIGFNLFERSHRKLSPNERGKIVYSYANEIFRLGNEMIETMNDRPTAKRVHLQVGVLDTIPKHLTVQLVSKAMSEKNCSISVTEGSSKDLLSSLIDHKIDLVVTNFFPTGDPGQIYAKRIAKLQLWVAGGKSFLGLRKNFPESLNGQPFIVPTSDSRARHEFDNFCKLNNIAADYLAETQDVMIQKLLAIKQFGLTVVPEFSVREYLVKKELFLIGKLPGLFEELYLISASRKIEHPVASYLMSHFQIK